MKKSKILTILMVLVLMVSLVACSTTKNNDKSQSNNTADISNLIERILYSIKNKKISSNIII